MKQTIKQQLLEIAKPYPHCYGVYEIEGCKFETEWDEGWVLFVYKDHMDKNFTWYNQFWSWAVNPTTKEIHEAAE